jgi:hypothetical protein
MYAIIGALLLGTAASPHQRSDDDDDRPTAAAAPGKPKDEDSQPKSASTSSRPPDEDDKTGAASARQPGDQDEDDEEDRAQPSSPILVTAQRLDAARTQIDAALGATLYSLTNEAIENRPGGETGSLADILMQAPGVTLSGSTLNVRGSQANEVRINNVIIPEAISDPADLLSSRLAETTRLITGTLPAQFGFAPAGVISVTTKNGLYQHGGQAELFGSTDGMLEPAFEWAGSAGATSLFASGELERSHSFVADTSGEIARDDRSAVDGLAFADHVIDEENRLSFIFGGSHARERIGATAMPAGTELNDDGYGVATFQHSNGGFTLQTSLFLGSQLNRARFSSETLERRSSWGTQIDAAEALDEANTVRFGLLAERLATSELVAGNGKSSAASTSIALYVQDEWRLGPELTFNPGTRLEWLRGLDSRALIEPRASLVWKPAEGWTGHIGYARYALAPSANEQFERIALPDERDDYLDAGVERNEGAFTFGTDAYWRSSHNYIAQYEAPGSAIATLFEFGRGRMSGIEFFATYAGKGMTAWANLSLSRAEGKRILGGQGLFAPQAIAAAAADYIPLASDRPVTATGGLTRSFGKLSLGGDLLLSSGAVRTTNFADPNGSRHRSYATIGFSAVYHARIARKAADLRLDLTNATNNRYWTSDATALEGGWARRARGRAITFGIEQGF